MSDERTARLELPLLASGQAQKEMWHNEALALIDLLLGASVEAIGLDTPPATPQPGQCWIVGGAPSGDWMGHAGAIAGWTAGGWRFVPGRAGLVVRVAPAGTTAWHDGTGWNGGDSPAVVGAPSGGAVVDTEARACLEALLGVLRQRNLVGSG